MRRNLIKIIFLLLFVMLGCGFAALLINEPVGLGGIGQAVQWGWWR